MSEVEQILLDYHADKIGKQQAMSMIEELIDADRIGLRDTFAGHAMQGFTTNTPGFMHGFDWKINISHHAYEVADLMLAERAK